MFRQRPFSAREAEGSGQWAVALGFESGSGCCWRGCPGSHRTLSECLGCSSELTLRRSSAQAAIAGLADETQVVKTDMIWCKCSHSNTLIIQHYT